mmetsp:Transcript_19287/g.40967  ORF Transcript_19287/g.40967 Transcript_19287/m.40967 type:complete len:94 (-) Transcript_19287:411-692(-)
MSCIGILKKVMDGKGYGFIENADGSGDFFVHYSKLTNGGVEDMVVGSEMAFDIDLDQRSGKSKAATNVTITKQANSGYSGGRPEFWWQQESWV